VQLLSGGKTFSTAALKWLALISIYLARKPATWPGKIKFMPPPFDPTQTAN